MNRLTKKTKLVLIIAAAVFVTALVSGVTYAWFVGENSRDGASVFTMATVDIEVSDPQTIEVIGGLASGGSETIEFTIINKSNIPTYIRARVVPIWQKEVAGVWKDMPLDWKNISIVAEAPAAGAAAEWIVVPGEVGGLFAKYVLLGTTKYAPVDPGPQDDLTFQLVVSITDNAPEKIGERIYVELLAEAVQVDYDSTADEALQYFKGHIPPWFD